MVAPYLCSVIFEMQNLRSHEKKFTGPRGSKKMLEKRHDC